MMKTSDNPLPFDLDEGEKILWTLHKPQPSGSMKLRILLWCVAVVLGILALVLLSSDFALAFLLGTLVLLCVSGAEHSYTSAPHFIRAEQRDAWPQMDTPHRDHAPPAAGLPLLPGALPARLPEQEAGVRAHQMLSAVLLSLENSALKFEIWVDKRGRWGYPQRPR